MIAYRELSPDFDKIASISGLWGRPLAGGFLKVAAVPRPLVDHYRRQPKPLENLVEILAAADSTCAFFSGSAMVIVG